jgi:hypothetical protein
MKNLFTTLIVWLLVSTAYAENAVLDTNGKLLIPELQIKGVGGYSVILEKVPNTLMPMKFKIQQLIPLNKNFVNPSAVYYPTQKTATINGVKIDGVRYNMTLKVNGSVYETTRFERSSQVSLLFVVTSPAASYKSSGIYSGRSVGNHFVMDAGSAVKLFSDRPYRIAEPYPGGLAGFSESYNKSDFVTGASEYPNVVFTGTNKLTGKEVTSIFVISDVFISGGSFVVVVNKAIGSSKLPDVADYSNTSLFIDNWFSDAVNSVGDALSSAGSSIATAAENAGGAIVSAGSSVLSALESGSDKTVNALGQGLKYLCTTALGNSVNGAFAISKTCQAAKMNFSALCTSEAAPLEIESDGVAAGLCFLGGFLFNQACVESVNYFANQAPIISSIVISPCDVFGQ